MPFITFEGLDAAGKSTQIGRLQRRLLAQGLQVVCTRESGGTPLGRELRALVQERRDLQIAPLAEAFLYATDRAQHISELVRPALEQGAFVISDRYIDSSLAFQGVYLPLELISAINQLATAGLQPELTILCDLDVTTSRQRLQSRLAPLDRIESREDAYQERVRGIYLQLARENPERILMVNAAQKEEEQEALIWDAVVQRFRVQSP
ncbi:MAG: dTMP kinase [Symbiobacteriaceae bacterium]|nr:dTMP kinase [Symbiobacteriaceae bacterium]